MQTALGLAVRGYSGVLSRCRNVIYRSLGVEFGGYVWLRRVSIPRQWSDIWIDAGASLDDGVVLLASGPPKPHKLAIGRGTYINRNTILDAHDELIIGRDCLIGPGCLITDANHGTQRHMTMRSQPMAAASVRIEDDVWIGAGCVILPGVAIGEGAVIGAGSVVTREVLAYTKVAGAPARVMGRRE